MNSALIKNFIWLTGKFVWLLKILLLYLGGFVLLQLAYAWGWAGFLSIVETEFGADATAIDSKIADFVRITGRDKGYILLCFGLLSFYLAHVKKWTFLHKTLLLMISGYFLTRIPMGLIVFGPTPSEVEHWNLALFGAAIFLVPLMLMSFLNFLTKIERKSAVEA